MFICIHLLYKKYIGNIHNQFTNSQQILQYSLLLSKNIGEQSNPFTMDGAFQCI